MNAPGSAERFRLVVVSAGTSDPSSTRLLADRTAGRATALAAGHGHTVTVSVIDLREIAADISSALVSQLITPKLRQAISVLGEADGIIAATPVHKACPSGLFTSFFGVLDNDLLIAKPVVLAATAGTARHALVADDAMRPLFAYLRTMTAPTSLFAAPEDWSDPALATRVDRAALELVLLMESGFARKIKDESWQSYQHEYGSAGGAETPIDLDTDLMRLATGGSAGGSKVSADVTQGEPHVGSRGEAIGAGRGACLDQERGQVRVEVKADRSRVDHRFAGHGHGVGVRVVTVAEELVEQHADGEQVGGDVPAVQVGVGWLVRGRA